MKYEPPAGEHVERTAEHMVAMAAGIGTITAEFNDITLTCGPTTTAPEIVAAWQMESDARSKAYLESPEGIASTKAAEEYRKKAAESSALGILSFDCTDPVIWDSWVQANQDGYGACIMRYAARWAHLMDSEIKERGVVEQGQITRAVVDLAGKCSHDADTEGITGFMYGCAVGMLAKAWRHGEILRRWHNKETQTGTEGDKANVSGGVLNPALLHIR